MMMSIQTRTAATVLLLQSLIIATVLLLIVSSGGSTGSNSKNEVFAWTAVNTGNRRSPTQTSKLQLQQRNNIDPTFIPPDCISAGITEELCIDTSRRMQRIKVPVPTSIHADGVVGISYTYWPRNTKNTSSQRRSSLKPPPPPVILIHGFDSSNLEFRRLGSRLALRGMDTYAVDLLGWGYTQLDDVLDFSASAKVQALQSFIQQVTGTQQSTFCIAGASLGGAAAIETAVTNPNCVGLILIDAQGFVDGVGIMSALPIPLATFGVNVLKSIPLRSSANQISYYDTATYATDEAVTVGRLHCLRDGWNEALVNFMKSGGFAPSKFVSQVPVPSLVLWGRQDTILDGMEFATKFTETLPSSSLVWIEECGHVPHLEQPDQTADAIESFVSLVGSNATTSLLSDEQKSNVQWVTNGFAGIAGISAIAASFSADWLPTF